MVMGVCLLRFCYERSRGHLFVLSWTRVRRVSLGSVVSELCTVSGMVFVTLLCCVVEVCSDYGGVNVFHVCLNFVIVYGVGVCVNVCGVVCVVVVSYVWVSFVVM